MAPGSLERARRAHTQENQTWAVGKGSSHPVRPCFFRPDRTNRSRVITHPGEPDLGRWKGLVAPCTPITQEYRTGVIGKVSSRPIRPYFFRPDQTNRSRVITVESTQEYRAGVIGKVSSRPIRPYFFRPDQTNRSRVITVESTQEYRTGVIGKGSSRPIRPILFRPVRTNRSRVITENQTSVVGKGSSLPIRPYFFRPDRTNRSRVITHLGEPDLGRWKGLVAPCTPITEENRNGVFGKGSSRPLRAYFFRPIGPIGAELLRFKENKGKKNFSSTIFFSETIAPTRTGSGSLERARRDLYAHIFFVQIGPIGAELLRFKGNKGKKHFSLTIFFSETIAPRSTGPGTQENQTWVIGKGSSHPVRPCFFRPDRTNRSRVITHTRVPDRAPRSTGPGSLERARRALYSHIFFVQIELGGADTQEYRTGVIGKGSSRPIRPYFFRPDRTNRSRVITENGTGVIRKGSSRPVGPFFFPPDRTAPRRTGQGSLERARRALYAHIFFVQIGPIGADTEENRTAVVGKGSSLPLRPYFFRPDQTNRSRVITHPGEPDLGRWKGLVAPCTPITQEYRTGVIGKVSSRPIRPYFFRPDQTNRSRVITVESTQENRAGVVGKGSSRPLRAYFFRPDRTNRSRVITDNRTGVIGKGSSLPIRPYFFRPDRTNRSRVITENQTSVVGKGSSHPVRPCFFRPDRTNRSRVITHRGEPERGLWKGLVAPSTHIFFSSRSDQSEPSYYASTRTGSGSLERARRGLYAHIFFVQIGPIGAELLRFKGNKGQKHFSLTIFFSETIAPRRTGTGSLERAPPTRTGSGSLERARRDLYAHIFFVQIGPIGAELLRFKGNKGKKHFSLTIFFSETIAPRSTGPGRTRPGSLERARRTLYAHVFFVQIGLIGADTQEYRTGVIGKGSSLPLRPYFFRPDQTNRSRVITVEITQENQTWVIGKGSSHPVRPCFFRPDRTNRSRVITHPGVPDRAPRRMAPGSLERARRAHTQENRAGVVGKGSSRPLRAYFFRPDRTNRSRVITHPGEPDLGRWKGLVAPCTPITQEYRSGVIGKGSSLPLRLYFFRPDQTNRSRVITVEITQEYRTGVIGKGSSRPIRPYFFRPDRTNRRRVITENGTGVIRKGSSRPVGPYFFPPDRTAPRRTGQGSLERARRALYAHIFFVQIGPIGADTEENRTAGVGKGSSLPLRPYFFRPDQTNRSRVITVEITQENQTWVVGKGSSRPLRAYFSRPDRTNRSRVITGTKEKNIFLQQFFLRNYSTYENRIGVLGKGSSRPVRPYFFRPDRTNRSRVITATKEKNIFFDNFFLRNYSTQENQTWVIGKVSSRPIRPYFFRPDQTNRSRVITVEREQRKKTFFLTIFFSETVAPTRTGSGSLERARRALYAHIFFVQIGPVGAEKKNFSSTIFFSETIAPRRTGPVSLERARRSLYAHIFFVQIGPNRTGVIGKGSSLPIRPYFFRPDRTNRSRVITENGTGVIGKGSSRPVRPYFSHPDRTSRSRVITHLGEPDRGHWKGLVASSTPIFFSSRSDQEQKKKNLSSTIFFSETIAPRRTGPGSLERARRTLYDHIFFVQIGPENGTGVIRKGSSRPVGPYFFPPDRTAPRRTGQGSLERARRALYAHIFFVQIGPIGADTEENRTAGVGKGSSLPLRPYFFRPDQTNRSRVITVEITQENQTWVVGKGSSRPLRAYFSRPDRTNRSRVITGTKEKNIFLQQFFLRNYSTYENRIGVLGKGSSRPVRPYFFRPDRTNRSRVITGTKEKNIFFDNFFLRNYSTQENQTWVIGKVSSRPIRPYFFRPDQTNRSRVITVEREQRKKTFFLTIFFSETVAPTRTGSGSLERARRALYAHIFFVQIGPVGAEKKNFSSTIFFSETIAPRRTGPVSLERARRSLYAHIFFVQIGPNRTGVIGKGSSLPIRPYFFRPDRTNRSRVITENGTGVIGKGSSRPVRPYFSHPDRTSRSRVITHLGEPDRGHWKGLVAPSTPIFFSSRSDQEQKKKNLSSTIFFSETIAPRRTGPGSLERARRTLYDHIFFVQIGPVGTEEQRKKNFFSTIFFSETIAPRRTGPDSLERARHAHYAHIFLVKIGPTGADTQEYRTGVTGKGSSRPVGPYFFRPDRTTPRRTGQGSLERARRALYAHIFFVLIGPIGAEEQRKKTFFLTIFFSETVAPTRTGSRSFERARRALYAHIFFVQIGPEQRKKNFSSTIFFSETIAPRRTGPGSLERARRSLYAHIFFVQIGPEPSYNGLKGTKKKNFSSTIFFSETVAPRSTAPGSLERARRSLYAHIFFVQIGPENRTGVIGKGSSLPIRPYFFRPDRTNRSRVITENGTGVIGMGSSRPVRPYFSHPDRTSRSRVITENRTGVIGKGSSLPLRPYFFRPDRTSWSRVITHLGEPDRGRWKGPVAPSRPIFFSSRSDQSQENRAGVFGKGSSRPVRAYFIRPYRTSRSRVITHLGEPDRGHWKGLVAPSTPIFFSSRSDQEQKKKNFSSTIFFSETIAPRRTGPGSSERARRSLYAHIFFVQIGPVGAERTGPGSLERARRSLYAHIFFVQIGPHLGEWHRGQWKGLVAPSRPMFFSSRSDHTQENRVGVVGKGSSRPVRPYLFRPDRTNRSRVITHLREPDRGLWKGLVALCTSEYRTGVIGKGSSLPIPPYFFRPDRPSRSRVITHLGEPDRGLWKGLVAPCTRNKGKKNFSSTIFFSETIAPRRNGPGSLERARRSLYAHIFFVQIGPVGADTQENRAGVVGKGSSRPVRPYFFRPDRTSRSRVITEQRKKNFSSTIFFSETIAPRRTGPGSLERARRSLYAHIFFVQIGPENRTGVIGKGSSLPIRPYFFRPDRTNRSRVITENGTGVIGKGSSRPVRPYFSHPDRTSRSRVITHLGEPDRGHWKGLVAPSTTIFFSSRSDQEQRKKNFFSTIFFSETIAPRRTGPDSLERARHAHYAHIFLVKIGPTGADTQEYRTGVTGKGSSRPVGPYFFRPDRTSRSRLITEPSYNGLKGTKEKNIFFNNFFLRNCGTYENRIGVFGKGSSRPVRPYFFRPDRTSRSRIITHLGEPDRGHRKGLVAPSTPIFFSSRSDHTQEYGTGVIGKGSSLPIRPYFFRPDQTNRSRVIMENRTGVIGKGLSLPLRPYFFRPDRTSRNRHLGEPDRGHWKGLVAPSTPIFFSSRSDQREPSYNAPRRTGPGSLERARHAHYAHIFFVQIGPHLGEPDRGHWKGLVAPSTPIFFSSRSDQRTGPGSLERARRSLYAHIFFVQIGPENRTGVAGKGPSRPVGPYFFRPDRTSRNRVITVLREQRKKTFFFKNFFLRNCRSQENRAGVFGKGSSRPVRAYFIRPYRTSRSRVITHLGEPDRGYWKGLVAPSTPIFFSSRSDQEQKKKNFSSTIFFSETIAPRRTGPGSPERARRSLYTHIFFVQIGPHLGEWHRGQWKGLVAPSRPMFFSSRSDHTQENRVGVVGKGSSRPVRPYFFRPDRTNRSRVITHLREPDRGLWKGLVALCTSEYRTGVIGKGSSLPIPPYFFRPDRPSRSRVITHLGEPDRGLWKGLVAPCTRNKGKKNFSSTIFFSETIAPRRNGPGSLERARRSLYAHIFFVQIGPVGADL
ncbi:LOW QUALITY PROTEIN: hypothetical protein V1477_004491 [Vespula maculifrons]|uniref:Uncharacterized protein n=1 Tax=Vespula maculifrons TaxID=7453 RepID=A0ABD2CM26_VESMC